MIKKKVYKLIDKSLVLATEIEETETTNEDTENSNSDFEDVTTDKEN